MAALQLPKMTVDEYLAWAEGRPGRYELYAGRVYQMAPERAVHGRIKYAVQTALLDGIKRANVGCEMLPDGMTVRVDRHTAHEPDALVYCGPKLPADAIEVPNPVIVVEVLSPSTRHIDASAKLGGYSSIPSILHYLIFDPEGRPTLHHEPSGPDTFVTRIVRGDICGSTRPGWISTSIRCTRWWSSGETFRTGSLAKAREHRAPLRFAHLTSPSMPGSARTSQNLDPRRRRALFRAWHRGTREMDLLLGLFADAYIAKLSDRDLADFEALMEVPDCDLFAWVTGSETVATNYATPVYRAIVGFHAGRHEQD